MKKKLIIKTLGGISITLSVFLLLIVFSRFDQAVEGAKYAFSTANETALTSLGRKLDKPTSPVPARPAQQIRQENIIVKGTFDPNQKSSLTEKVSANGQEIIRHYQSISAQELKDSSLKPTLKLETDTNNQPTWVEPRNTRLDQKNGMIHFLIKTESAGGFNSPEIYTGKYQLEFEPID